MNKVYYLPKFAPGGKTDEQLAVRDNTRVAWVNKNVLSFSPLIMIPSLFKKQWKWIMKNGHIEKY